MDRVKAENKLQTSTVAKLVKTRRSIRVLMVDDHQSVREGLRMVIESQKDFVVVGEAADGEAAILSARALQPDVMLIDVNLPKISGIEATRLIKAEMPGIAIIGLSAHEDDYLNRIMREAGAFAYLNKICPSDVLYDTIRHAAREK